MKKIITFCLLSLAFGVTAYCEQPSKIVLTDGSVVNGEVVSFLNGVYTIKTTAFGEIKVGSEKISKIESLNQAPPGTVTNPAAQTDTSASSSVSTYGQKLMKDPENSAIVAGLASDPKFREMANDPMIQDAAKTGDIQALLGNPKFMEIVNSPELQEALKKIKK